MQALWLIILAIFWRRRPAMAVEANLMGIIQKGLILFEDEDARRELEDSPAARARLSAALIDAHRKVDLLIYLRALEIAGLRFHGRPFQPCRHPHHADRTLADLWRRFRRLLLRFEDAERVACLRAARLRHEHDTAIPACLLAAAPFAPDDQDGSPSPAHPPGDWSATRPQPEATGSCVNGRRTWDHPEQDYRPTTLRREPHGIAICRTNRCGTHSCLLRPRKIKLTA